MLVIPLQSLYIPLVKMFDQAKLEYELAASGKSLMDIEEIRKYVLSSLSETNDHVKITRCFEALTGYSTSSSPDKNDKWVNRPL